MKKIIAFLLALTCFLSLTACGGQNDELAAMQAQIDALAQQLDKADTSELEALKKENEELKAKIAELEAQLSAVSTEEPSVLPSDNNAPTPMQDEQISAKAVEGEYPENIIKAVNEIICTEQFAEWQQLYRDFLAAEPASPQVSKVMHYTIPDFNKVEMDCYLVAVSAGVGYWHDEEAQRGSAEEEFYLFVDAKTGEYRDSINTNAMNTTHDESSAYGRATYLIWLFGVECLGMHNGDYLNAGESKILMPQSDIDYINNNIA